MSFNFIDTGGKVFASQSCLYDSNIGYETDFSIDGDVNGWTLYDGIHTYGCWNNFLFGTLYGDTSLIGRHNVFRVVAAEQFYTIKIVMKLNIIERVGVQNIPEYGKLAWTTGADPNWSSSKEVSFSISADNKWHTYNINMGEVQWWQGDVNNLRLYPILQDGRDGDEFFVRSIKILSIDSYKCNNTSCEYFSEYQHPCVGVGKRGKCSSKELDPFVQEGTMFDFAVDKKYTIVEDVNDEFLVNINDYGYESIKLPPTSNATGAKMAKIITKEISKINVGGYSEVFVEYTTDGQFVIHSGTYVSDSTVKIGNSEAAATFDFYDEFGNDLSTKSTGESPVSGYRPLSSFRVGSNKILSLFSGVENTGFFFNPFTYNIEGGRKDWLDYGLGVPSRDVRGQEDDDTGIMNRYYDKIDNAGKTIIDFNHPFNASGRITNLFLAVTLDNYESSYDSRGDYDEDRIDTQLENAKVMFFRPLKDGTLKVLDIEVSIENRDHASGNLYSATQEYVEIDCDVFVNKGDLIGIYNAHVYKGRSVSGSETDALFYQGVGKASGILDVNTPLGEGSSGLLLYARSDQIQNRLVVELDLSKRINIESVDVIGSAVDEKLEYNIARCLDVNWTVDLFDEDHTTGWVISYRPYVDGRYNHPNIYYGKDCLTDGIKTVPDGLSATSFSVNLGTYYRSDVSSPPPHIQNGGNGIVLYGAKYFQVNGDSEWLANYLLAGRQSPFAVEDYKRDPIAFTLLVPYGKKKKLNKLKVYFKERYNFRSFALSFFKGDSYQGGTADISTFDLIPYRSDGADTPWSKLILDGIEYVPEYETGWNAVDLYLAHNPAVGHEILEASSIQRGNYDPVLAYYGGSPDYDERGTIINNDQLAQARSVDWTTLSIEWPKSNELGFRLYCDYHESTKICEMELFCTVEDVGSSMAGSVSVTHSDYGETLWLSNTSQDIYGNVKAFIGDTPRHITVEIAPITEIELRNISVNIGEGNLFVGEKGCQLVVLPDVSKINEENASVPIVFKNVYNGAYDLYVDIIENSIVEDGLIFYSRLNNAESITNPEVGSDSYYKKEPSYNIRNDNYNVAINCPVYGLKNLVEGAVAWYSHDDGYSWNSFGTLSSDENIDFSNITSGDFSVINIPVISRNRYWKIGWLDEDHSQMNIREMRLFYDNEPVDCDFYHDVDLDFEDGPISDTAVHLNNGSIIGSYYGLEGGSHIGIDLGSQKIFDKIILFNDSITDYDPLHSGIDKYTELNLTVKNTCLVDYSYDEREFSVVGGVDVATGKWDFDLHEVTTVSGLFSSSDITPISCVLGVKPELVDGVLWDETINGNGITLNTNRSIGVDLGETKEINRIRFYLNLTNNYSNLAWNNTYPWYIYKSNDNINWVLCYTMKNNNPLLQIQDNSWEFIVEFFFPVNQTARYFKLWCPAYMYVSSTQGWYNTPTCSEIKVFSEIPNSYKTGIEFSGGYISVPASEDFTFPGVSPSYPQYGDVAEPFTIDFHVKFNSLPVVSGTNYCTLIRSWADPVTTVKWGNIPFPPEDWMNGSTMEQGGVGFPDANYAIFVKSVYNLARVSGAIYSCSSVSWGVCEDAFNDINFNSVVQWTTAPPCYAQCTLPEAKKVIKYGVYGYYSPGHQRQPIDWKLQGYIGGTWVDLHVVVGHPLFIQYHMEYWEFDNPYSACTNYRLYVTKNEGNATYTRLPNIQLFDYSEHIIPVLYQIEFWIQSSNPYNHTGGTYSAWNRQRYEVVEGGTYHISLTRGTAYNGKAYVNGERCGGSGGIIFMEEIGMISHSEDLIIGENLNGVISDLRITKDVERTDQYPAVWHRNERYYTMSVYVSEDNFRYGKLCDLDLYKETSYDHYYYPENVWSSDYYNYFAIDLGHCYSLDIIRSFPVDEAYQFDINNNVLYSNINTSDPDGAFIQLSIEDISTDFSGQNKTLPDNWTAAGGSENYILNNKLYQSITSGYTSLTTKFYLVGDFDFEIDYELIGNINTSSWFCGLQIQDISNVNNVVRIDRGFYSSNNNYRFNIKDNSSSWVTAFSLLTNHRTASIRFIRTNQTFVVYVKNLDVSYPEEYTLFGSYTMTGGFGEEATLGIINESTIPGNPTISVEWDNLIFNVASPIYSSYMDARWIKIRMLGGDGVTRTIKKVGIYPDISVQVSKDGNYNTEWESLGESVTSYVGEENVAIAADVEASSYVGVMIPENAVNGLLTSELQQAWGSEKGVPQWITVTLPQEMQIYRIKLHLGYDASDTDHLIQNYTVQISDDNETFSTIFTVTGNTSFLRTHDLIDPVTTSYVRIYITAYKSEKEYVQTSSGYGYWAGASIRQIEIYEYYGNTIISSEEYPTIAIDLKQNYFIRGHDVVGVDTENLEIDWNNGDSNYTYSNSNLSEPKKVTFGEWGDTPNYEKWVAIKRNTATHYPLVPELYYEYRDTIDYLKHVKIYGSVNEDEDKPNPVEHCWMWRSNISELGYSYDYIKGFCNRSLSIKYPASSQSDHIHFIEGDNFGIDEFFSWRDGLGFYWYIDDIETIDLSYGYIYFGGYDSTETNNEVVYKWNIATLSGVLHSGWNGVTLGMKYADEVEWTAPADPAVSDPRILHNLTLQKIGMVFKGKGVPLTMYINGFVIERSHFKEGGMFDVGLYLHKNDLLKINVGDLDFHSGTIEFFIRPDWNLIGKDKYKEYRFRSLFHLSNIANDVFGASISQLGIEIYHGNLTNDFTLFKITDLNFGGIDQIMHMAFVFSNDGVNIGDDGSTIRVYINTVLIAKSYTTWRVSDEKLFNFIFGGQSLLVQKMQGGIPKSSSVDGVISNIKIHNYCKTDFRDSIRSADIEGDILLTKPSDLIEISKDNVTFYRVGDEELPFHFEDVPHNEVVPIYVKTTIPKGLTGKERRTAEILGQWDIGV